jgi:hypothetical protein
MCSAFDGKSAAAAQPAPPGPVSTGIVELLYLTGFVGFVIGFIAPPVLLLMAVVRALVSLWQWLNAAPPMNALDDLEVRGWLRELEPLLGESVQVPARQHAGDVVVPAVGVGQVDELGAGGGQVALPAEHLGDRRVRHHA